MSTRQELKTAVFPETEAGGVPDAAQQPPAPRAVGNAIHFGPRTRRLIRAIARVVNPLVLRIPGRLRGTLLDKMRRRGTLHIVTLRVRRGRAWFGPRSPARSKRQR